MLRRKFLQQIAWLTGGLLFSRALPARSLFSDGKTIRGRVLSKKSGLNGVVVSDGYSVVSTNANGEFEFRAHPDAVAVFVSTPAGYEFPEQNGITRHYRLMQDLGEGELRFELKALKRSDRQHRFLIWADPQVKNAKDVAKMMEETVPDVRRYVKDAGRKTLVHGICVGDIVWDELKLFADYDKAVRDMGIPFFQCLGNHDMDYRKGGDETSDDTFQLTYGPTYYSFNRGEVHYVVMDNVRYLGREREYDGFIQQHQLDWLAKDLQFVGKDKLIVLCVHIPVDPHTKNRNALYEILKGRNVHIMSGHTHYNVNAIRDGVYEHNHGTVCGAWWTGPICEDGTPCGYGIYEVNGTELSWHYKSTGMPSDYQMKLYQKEGAGPEKNILANIWNFDPEWKTEYWVDGVSKGALEQYEDFDPDAYKAMLGPDLPKPRGFAEPKKTKHVFRASVPNTARKVKVQATDRFGKKYSSTLNLS